MSNAIRSMYGLGNPANWIGKQILENKEFTVYKEKEADSFLQTYGYTASVGERIKPLEKKISQLGTDVKRQFSISPVSDTDGQQEGQSREREDPAQTQERLQLPAKAGSYLEGAERELTQDLGFKLFVPRFARQELLKPVVQELSNAYLQDGTVDEEKVDFLFDVAFSHGIIADAEFYKQYKHVKDFLRGTPISPSQEIQSQIPDYPQFKKKAQ